VPQVCFHGGQGDEQVLSDLPVGHAVGGQAGHPPFGAGEGSAQLAETDTPVTTPGRL
jgi:hypothetical protein